MADRWTQIRPGADGLVLAVDFDATGRREATFRDLCRVLPGEFQVWRPLLPPDGDHIGWWQDHRWEAPVHAVLGYCAGSIFACALADELETRQARRPTVILFNPGPPTVDTLRRDFSELLATDGPFDADFDTLCAAYLKTYSEVCGNARDIDPDVGQQLVALFESYLAYLTAARAVPRARGWDSAVSLTSREHHATGFTAREIAFELGRDELLRADEVVATTHQLLIEGR